MRVLDAHKYEATQRLQQGCATLTDKVEQLNGLVRAYLDILDKQVGYTKFCNVRPMAHSGTQQLTSSVCRQERLKVKS